MLCMLRCLRDTLLYRTHGNYTSQLNIENDDIAFSFIKNVLRLSGENTYHGMMKMTLSPGAGQDHCTVYVPVDQHAVKRRVSDV